MRKFLTAIMFLIVFSLGAIRSNAETGKLIFLIADNSSVGYNESKWRGIVLKELFKRLEIKIEIRNYPALRASYMLERGEVDCEAVRSFEYGDFVQNAVRIDEALFYHKVAIYSLNPERYFENYEDLKNHNYSIGYRRGLKKIEKDVKNIYHSGMRLEIFDSVDQGLKMLQNERMDLYIEINSQVTRLLKEEKYKNYKIYFNGNIDKNSMHLYVNKKHLNLVPEINKTIKSMKKDNFFKKIEYLLK